MEIRERTLIDFCEPPPLMLPASLLAAPPGHSPEIILPIFREDEGLFKLGIQGELCGSTPLPPPTLAHAARAQPSPQASLHTASLCSLDTQ